MTNSMLVIVTSKKDVILEFISYICDLVYFRKSSNNFEVLIDFGNKVNIITFSYILK